MASSATASRSGLKHGELGLGDLGGVQALS